MDQQRGRGWASGVEAMRVLLVREFKAQGPSTFTGVEIAQLIERAPGPIREPDPPTALILGAIPVADDEAVSS